jgi:hypothetical protein
MANRGVEEVKRKTKEKRKRGKKKGGQVNKGKNNV